MPNSIVMAATEADDRFPMLAGKEAGNPLLIYLPAFAIGLAGENIIAGAGNDVTVGFLLLIALASVPHRSTQLRVCTTSETIPVYPAA